MQDLVIFVWIACILLPIGIIAFFAPMPREKRLIFVSIVAFIGIMIPLLWFSRWQSVKLFDQLTQQTFTQIIFQTEKQEAVIKDPAEISTFLRILKTAPEVWGHHSSPVGKVIVIFAGRQERFSLGADSQKQDEYWFMLEPYTYIKQFHSEDMTLWLRQNALPLIKPSKTRPSSRRHQPAAAAE